MEEIEKESCIRGYHVYKDTWQANIGDELECVRQPGNSKDRFAVATLRNNTIVGHLPKKISTVCSLFLRRGGTIKCLVTGRRRYSTDLQQGGLEVPCRLFFKGDFKIIKKLKKCIPNE